MRNRNLIFILSDEHAREVAGCYGNTFIKTPNIDTLAKNGTRFENAYTNCPICVPARASLATGRYVHQIRLWDNAFGYTGQPKSWGHRLIEEGYDVVAIGKLHYRSKEDSTGWTEEIDTLHIVDGVGDRFGMLRNEKKERASVKTLAERIGPGDSSYIQYDNRIAAHAEAWLANRKSAGNEKPWVLFVGFVLPHFPLIAPPELYEMYAACDLPPPRHYARHERPDHPALNEYLKVMDYDRHFDEEKVRIARASYFGMVSTLDRNVGRVLDAMRANGLESRTSVIYTSDHGDNMGHHGFWGKSVMYEESVGVPLIMAGPEVAKGKSVATPVSLVDIYPTVLENAGVSIAPGEQAALPGMSLFGIANGARPDGVVLSEYHAVGSASGSFMIRHGRWKYVHYVGYPSQLFDLLTDPTESVDLAGDPAHLEVLQACEKKLRQIVDPEAADARAFADQAAMIEAHGGVEAIRKNGEFPYTPAPGEKPGFRDTEAGEPGLTSAQQ